jgi:hypothetical protein
VSHFTVLVVGDDVEGQLAPYDENMEVEAEPQYWDEKDLDRFEAYVREMPGSSPVWSVATAKRAQVLSLMRGWNDYENRYDKEKQQFYWLSTYNPQSKWDWWVIGGRWRGFFKLKDGPEAVEDAFVGAPGSFGNEPEFDADQVRKGAIDFDAMRDAAAKEANETYDRYEEAVDGLDVSEFTPWSEFVDRVKAGEGAELATLTIEEAREEYRDQPYVQALHKAQLMPWMDDPSEVYTGGREQFVQRARNSVAVPYAVVMDGKWIGKGEMGWWGMSRDEMTEYDWCLKVSELYDSLDDDTLLTLVDCHI